MMENVHKIKIKLGNIWIDLIRGIYAPYKLFCADPDNGVVYAIMSGMYNARYCTSPRNFWTSL